MKECPTCKKEMEKICACDEDFTAGDLYWCRKCGTIKQVYDYGDDIVNVPEVSEGEK